MKLFSFLKKKEKKIGYTCSCCGQVYDEAPLCFGAAYPDYYFSVPPEERSERIELQPSLCVVDKEHFFHRGWLTIPIIDHNENLIFNVWTSISEENFGIRMDVWENPKRIDEDPYFGWLQTLVPTYGDTLNIKTKAVEQAVGLIPEIIVIEENHPLKINQDNGITYKQALEIVEKIMKEQHQEN
ncbi:DUF2199 domain-containing protein [Pedobacter frigiditerrae]|uniref:DUF2199 domain-containing protein n=1 Tax=Pedobacter frigiditerrae TaxID=2530452 RepID=A0A4R0MKR5_9SPHI|nr:DUF2199 domain-containing protein [Pedobacter frigiditerrae]TCC87245.1 DUF2199 domain-containing protein [Pedobacter frigiditerrae]